MDDQDSHGIEIKNKEKEISITEQILLGSDVDRIKAMIDLPDDIAGVAYRECLMLQMKSAADPEGIKKYLEAYSNSEIGIHFKAYAKAILDTRK